MKGGGQLRMQAEIGRVLRDFLFIALPRIAGGGLLIGLNLVLLRFFDVEQYGIYGVCMAAILLADAVLGGPFDLAVLRLGQAVAASNPRDDAAEIERAAFRLKLGAVAVIGVALVVVYWLSGASGPASRSAWLLIVLSCLVVAAMLALRSVLVHLQLRHRFMLYGAIDFFHVVVKFGTIAILLAVTSPGVVSLLALLAAGPLIAALVGAMISSRHLFGVRAVPSASYGALFDLTKWYLATVALGAFISHADILLLGFLGHIEQAGIFTGGQVIASMPAILGAYLGLVLTPRILPYARSGELLRLFVTVQLGLLVAAIVGYGLVLALWTDITVLLLPPNHLAAAQIVLILLPGTLVSMATVPLALPMVMFWHKTLILRMDCVVLPVLLVAYAVAIPRYGAVGAAWVTCIGCLIRSVAIQIVAWRCVTVGPAMPAPAAGI